MNKLSTEELLSFLSEKGIQISATRDQLKIRARRGVLDEEIKSKILENKADLIAHLASQVVLSFEQERLWFLDQMYPESTVYNTPSVLEISGALDVEALRKSLETIIQRHESLRTIFPTVNGKCKPQLVDTVSISIYCADLKKSKEEDREAAIGEWTRRETHHIFSLSRGPLVRVSLLSLRDQDSLLVINTHHIISDHWSMRVFIGELAQFYHSYVTGDFLELPLPELQYSDYARQQRRALEGARMGELLGYWQNALEGAPEQIELPTDFPRSSVPKFKSADHKFKLPTEAVEAVISLGRNIDATPFITLLAVFKVLLFRYSGNRDIVLGTTVANRGSAALESLIGFCVNTLAIRSIFEPGMTFQDVVSVVRNSVLGALEHQEMPFGKLVEELNRERVVGHNPIFQTMFNIKTARQGTFEFDGLTIEPLETDRTGARFDLALTVERRGSDWFGELSFDTTLFKEETAFRMAGAFCTLLEHISLDSARPVEFLGLLDAESAHIQLHDWNDTDREFPRDHLIHEVFENHAARDPDAIAVRAGATEVSYEDLNRRSNQMAHLLRSLGVFSGSEVALCLTRTPELIRAMLGIVKAGGAYVPFDLGWPMIRMQRVVNNLRIRVIVTEYSMLKKIQELQWLCPSLETVICLDINENMPPVETVNEAAIRGVFDHVGQTAGDFISAAGFVSSYSGEAFSAEEVVEYVNRVSEIARGLISENARVLEIGAGSGLIAEAIAPNVGEYIALEPSAVMRKYAQRKIRERCLENVQFVDRFAHELESEDGKCYDLVVAASVVQFFPGFRYLEEVIRRSIAVLHDGGTLLLADIPDLSRREELTLSLEKYGRATSQTKKRASNLDQLLFVNEDFFANCVAALGLNCSVTVLHRTTGFENELGYRYDVLIRKSSLPPAALTKQTLTAYHLTELSVETPSRSTTSTDPAYVIHTSGSTGEPKGIVVAHKSVMNLICWVNRTFGVSPRDQLLFVTSVCFDLSVYDVFGMLAAGGTICMADEEAIADPELLLTILQEQPITFWDSAPAFLQQFMLLAPSDLGASADSLRLVFNSGDWIPLALPKKVRGCFPNSKFVALGGATEATVWSNWFQVDSVDPEWTSIPYGKPIQNSRYYILDDHMNPCPIGLAGKLFIGGECLAQGYTDEELTMQKFVDTPPPGITGRLYDTGDQARFWSDGTIEFLGRLDQQVKIRGYRIEMQEVERALRNHFAVEDAIVIDQTSDDGEKYLAAYVTQNSSECEISSADLHAHIASILPVYMQPQKILLLENMPVTSNGKLDRAWLSQLEQSIDPINNIIRASTPEEQKILDIWIEMLQSDRIGVNDNFFDVGGHSLLLVRVQNAIKGEFGIRLPVLELLRYTTVRTLADFIGKKLRG